MTQNQNYDSGARRKGARLAPGFLADFVAAALLFGIFYGVQYGVPFIRQAYATVTDGSVSNLILDIRDDVSTGNGTSSSDSAATDTSTDDSAGAGTSAAETTADDSSDSASATVTDNSYTGDDMQITVTQYSSGSGNSKITWYVADIKVTDLSLMASCFADDTYGRGITDTVLNMAGDSGAILAVNGDYYSQQSNNIVIRNGELYQDGNTSSDLCVLYKDGTMVTYSPGEITADEALENGAWQAWNFGPQLLSDDGQALGSFNTSGRIASANPRTAIGYYEPGHYCLVVVDGRSPGYSAGMTLSQLSQLFEDLGCTQAYNLDGGKSSVMVFNGEIVNQPADGGREVSDAITLG